MTLKKKYNSKKLLIVVILYLGFISESNGQDLTIRSLIRLTECESYLDFQDSIEKQGFAFYKTEGSPETNIYSSIVSLSSPEQGLLQDLCTFSSTKEGIEIGYLTTKKKNADSILLEIN